MSQRFPAVRPATAADMPAVTAIYRASVEATAASFETVAPGVGDMERRWQAALAARCPYLVAEVDGAVVGYAYARPFHERAAFAWTIESSIYIAPRCERQGVGAALLSDLIEASAAAGFRQMIALISSDAESASVPLHLKLGFAYAGRLSAVGFKNGRWHDIIHMQRPLGRGSMAPPV